ncbi:hypothetical protein BK764_28300 [Bacillus thuringiensis serovar israelensis]|nr:hypothetical protein BK719_03610 [Bacillus thuringiensis serovar novosibirsk]OTZ51252.1 hypothetical protein BK764_28300 [Bacillus thuringiensis serovar israelensis]
MCFYISISPQQLRPNIYSLFECLQTWHSYFNASNAFQTILPSLLSFHYIKKFNYLFHHKIKENSLTELHPIVRHSLTIGGAVFLWLNLQLMKKYKLFYVI